MRLDKATITFEIDELSVEMDVLCLQMAIEALQTKHGDSYAEILNGVRSQFTEFNINLTDTQAWTVIQATESAYESFKKKLKAELESDFGTTPIHFRLEQAMSSGLKGSSLNS